MKLNLIHSGFTRAVDVFDYLDWVKSIEKIRDVSESIGKIKSQI